MNKDNTENIIDECVKENPVDVCPVQEEPAVESWAIRMKKKMPNFFRTYSLSKHVSHSILDYITPSILATLFIVSTVVGLNFTQLLVNYKTNVPLNSIILIAMFSALIGALWSNYQLWRTSKYIKNINEVSEKENIPESDIVWLKTHLSTNARVLDTKNMYGLLDNLGTYGHLNVSDNDSRLIKSKLGFRVSKSRASTSFMAGLLVMLGLLGTFWGLLLTIDAVGEAMAGMASMSTDSEEGMGGFISSIAAPLQGMGLAFSSSLFGLSGSLLLGFFNFLCGGVHDRFIENLGRWFDEGIPTPDKNMQKSAKNSKVAGSDELKAWLAGFVQTSQMTQRKIGELVGAMSDVTETSRLTAQNTQHILEQQSGLAISIKTLDKTMNGIQKTHAHIGSVITSEFATKVTDGQALIGDRIAEASKMLGELKSSSADVRQGLDVFSTSLVDGQDQVLNACSKVEATLASIGDHLDPIKNVDEGDKLHDILHGQIEPVQQTLVSIDRSLEKAIINLQHSQELSSPADKIESMHDILQEVGHTVSESREEQSMLRADIRSVASNQVSIHKRSIAGATVQNLVTQLQELLSRGGSKSMDLQQLLDKEAQNDELAQPDDKPESGIG